MTTRASKRRRLNGVEDTLSTPGRDSEPASARSSTRVRKLTKRFEDQASSPAIKETGKANGKANSATTSQRSIRTTRNRQISRQNGTVDNTDSGNEDQQEDSIGGTIVVNGSTLSQRKSKRTPVKSKKAEANAVNGVNGQTNPKDTPTHGRITVSGGRTRGSRRQSPEVEQEELSNGTSARIVAVEDAGNLDVRPHRKRARRESSPLVAENYTVLQAPDLDISVAERDVPKKKTKLPQGGTKIRPEYFGALKKIVLGKLASRRPIPPTNLTSQHEQLQHLLKGAVEAGESNSLLIVGPRGTGKTALVNYVLSDLVRDHGDDFHVIRLDGFIQSDDRLAVREMWRQLGREMELDDEAAAQPRSFSDALLTLLATLSHPDEQQPVNGETQLNGDAEMQVSKAVIFILSEFDLFASRPRQTLLYNLFDIAQSRKAPIAVVGLSTRGDVAEMLEKRVKSRFGHRFLHCSLPRDWESFESVIRAGVRIEESELSIVERSKLGPSLPAWNDVADALLRQPRIRANLQQLYYTTKSLPDALTALYFPVAALTAAGAADNVEETPLPLARAPDSAKLTQLPTLPLLALALLISVCRLDSHMEQTSASFEMAYAHYTELCAAMRTSTSSTSSGRAAATSLSSGSLFASTGGKPWSKPVARQAWESLLERGLTMPVSASLLSNAASGGPPVSAAGAGASATNGSTTALAVPPQTIAARVGPADLVRADVALEEIEGVFALEEVVSASALASQSHGAASVAPAVRALCSIGATGI